ncbi:MAG: stage II sporulation protein D [Bacillota bacterium]
MKRKIVRLAGRLRLFGTSRTWSLFGVGVLLGAALVFVRLSLAEIASSRESAEQAILRASASTASREVQETIAAGSGSSLPVQKPAARPKPVTDPVIAKEAEALDRMSIRIYLTKEKRIETVPLETYVQGVLAGEMPIDFKLEALKAQAIAARTYIVRRIGLKDRSGMKVEQADVTDTIEHQVYIPIAALVRKWTGEEKKENLAKLKQASEETKDLVITYEGEPIQAAFFSTSNGYTENSEDYWAQPLPYLRSVASPWDAYISPRYKETVKLTKREFYFKMGLSGKNAAAKPAIKVTEKTEGNRIKTIKINGETFSGREVRERLDLASSQFTWTIQKDTVTITTFGFGHGVGMSQWGANGMAQEGKKAEDIVRHYYTGTKVEQASKLPIQSDS